MNWMEQWRNLYGEVVRFTDAIQGLPEECRCGDADAHLEGRCRCCHGHRGASAPHGGAERCGDIVARLHADLSLLCEDFRRAGGALEKGSSGTSDLDVRRNAVLAAGDLEKTLLALERLGEAVVGFRTTCAMSEMRQVKRHSAALREHCDRLDAELGRD